MSFLKNIFARIWAFWGLISFVFTFLIIIIPSMCSHLYKDEKKGQDFFIKVSKIWMSVWLFLIGCSLKVIGKENFKKNTNYIIVFNHNALLDIPLSAPFVPSGNKTIGKDSFAKVPIFGWFYKRGAILVNRKNEKSRSRSYDAMKQILQKGIHMCLYPEGTRNRTDKPLKEFYDGAFKLAIDTKKEIIPCVITGTKKAMPINKPMYLLPTKLKMIFLPPVSFENTDVKSLNKKVFDIMEKEFIAKS
ncbi:MAG: lysophospholipid acyltransferase family protein [Ferruginibacter sp.]|nr:1-acyl-sn-glycerol-3-phosphate acyltransferase [Ferruginibacter sp.]